MTRTSIVCLAVLLGAGCFVRIAGAAEAGKGEKLIKGTLVCEGDAFGVVPLYSVGADIVNLTGRGEEPREGTKRMTVECLPGATVWLIGKEADHDNLPILTLLPEDDGKTLRLKLDKHVSYKNDVPFSVDLTKAGSADVAAKRWEAAKRALEGKKLDGLTLAVDVDAGSLSVLRELKGTGVGLFLPDSLDETKLPKEAVKALRGAVGDVEPRRLTLMEGGFAVLGASISKVESLHLKMEQGKTMPDLSKLAALKYLMLDDEGHTLDLKPLEKLTQLKVLTVTADECRNAGAIGLLRNLEFLVMMFKSPGDSSIFKDLPNLRYLAAEFPADADYSFAEKMPRLQTLCIANVSEKHNLKPLEKLKQLRCLALSRSRERDESKTFVAGTYANVNEFRKARPDVEVVEYRGICLGSLWMLLLAVMAAAAAWAVRRCRVGGKLACQP